MREGVRLGVDVGKVRIGVARSDAHGLLATPVETVARGQAVVGGRTGTRSRTGGSGRTGAPGRNAATDSSAHEPDVERIAELAQELAVVEIVIGLPVSLSGEHTASTADALQFARRIGARIPDIDVRMVDERLSTVSAYQALRTSGKKSRGSRPIIDQVAAVIILQHALDSERASGMPPGSAISPDEGL